MGINKGVKMIIIIKIFAFIINKFPLGRILNKLPKGINVYYEIRSWIGRHLSEKLLLNKIDTNYLNLGSGGDLFSDFINVDSFTNYTCDYQADLRYPLEISSLMIDGIFTEHTIEHLTFGETELLLQECYRIMKKDATIRIIIPNFGLFISNYCENNNEWFKNWEKMMFSDSKDFFRSQRKLETNMNALSFVAQEYGHISLWDYNTMKYYLQKSGFSNIKKYDYNVGRNKDLLKDNESIARKTVSL